MPPSIFVKKKIGYFFPGFVITQGNIVCFSTMFVCLVGNPYTVVAISKGEGGFHKAIF